MKKSHSYGMISSSDYYRVAILIALVALFGVLTDGVSVSSRGLTNVLQQSAVIGIAAIGQAFVMLTGAIDISLYGVGLLVAVLGGVTMTSRYDLSIVGGEPWPIVAGLTFMIAAGMIFGLINGLVTVKLRVPALITTFGTWQIAQGLVQYIGKGYTITDLPEGLEVIGRGEFFGIPLPIVGMFLLFAAAFYILNFTTFGRSVYAVGGNAGSAYLSGINVQRIQIAVFVISGLLISLAAISIESRLMAVSNRTLDGIAIDSIAAVTVGGLSIYGGRGTIFGVLLGTLILGVITNGLNTLGTTPDIQGISKGILIILAVAVDAWRERRRSSLTTVDV